MPFDFAHGFIFTSNFLSHMIFERYLFVFNNFSHDPFSILKYISHISLAQFIHFQVLRDFFYISLSHVRFPHLGLFVYHIYSHAVTCLLEFTCASSAHAVCCNSLSRGFHMITYQPYSHVKSV